MRHALPVIGCLLGSAGLAGCFKYEQPTVVVQADPEKGAFPHALLDEALEGRVDAQGHIDYRGLQADRGALDAFLAYVARVSPQSDPQLFPTRESRLAYYINAYNALAIRGVIDRPGLTSVDDIKIAFFFYTRYDVGGRKLDLYRLENKVIRPMFDDPRIHFALNCQSVGCPVFPPTAFHPDGIDDVLDAQTEAFVSDPDNVRQNADGSWEVSQIFQWYARDFEDDGGVAAFIHEYREAFPEDASFTYIPYDWSLIAQPGKGP